MTFEFGVGTERERGEQAEEKSRGKRTPGFYLGFHAAKLTMCRLVR